MNSDDTKLWESVERDKFKYKVFLMLSMLAWGIAIGTLVYIGYLFWIDYLQVAKQYQVGVAGLMDLNEAKKNIYTIVLSISVILACLASVVVIMRQRSASLQDIQLRLAMVEQQIRDK